MPETPDERKPSDEVSPEAMDDLVNTLRDAARRKTETTPTKGKKAP